MRRLIDADKLILSLNDFMLVESPTDTENTEERRISEMVCKIIQHCIEVVEEQPTAYDVEKVERQIKDYFCKVIDKQKGDTVPFDILEYNKAICEIVRSGGVE